MKKLAILFVALFCYLSNYAAYLRDVPVTVTQPDGTVLHCFASGDEYFNYLHDKDGFTIIQHPTTGYYVYAQEQNGQLIATSFVAGKYDPTSKGLKPYALISPEEWIARRKAWDVPDPRPKNRDFKPNHGTLNNISIFIRFSDDSEFTNTYSSIDNMFNDMSGNTVSMRSYFLSASYGAIDIPTTFYPGHNGETIISYQDTEPRNYFQPYNETTNPNGYQDYDERKSRELSLLERAVNYVNQNYPVPTDLDIDYDNDDYVDNVCFIINGNTQGWGELLWPHKSSLYDRYVYINNKRVYVYNFQLANSSHFTTSTMCHEMNHSLSAPDLYHYDYGTSIHPVGSWDLMHSNGTPPQHCGAYMKMKYGHWIDEIPEIIQAGTYTLNPISSATPENVAYKIPTSDPNQFYVLEYRDKSQEPSVPGSGLLIYRIDTRFYGNADYNPSNGVYDEVYIFRPNGTVNANGNYKTAHFSNNVNRTEFSTETNPYPFLSEGTIDNNFRIYDITAAGSTISFTYSSTSDCEPPTNLQISVNGRNIQLSWDAANAAQSYNIFRNGILLASTNETTYSDNDLLYGNYSYYIKSVDANGRNSTGSESVSAFIEPIPQNLNLTVSDNNALLSWTAPEWVTPQEPTNILTHGTQELSNANLNCGDATMYWGHRHPAESITSYNGLMLYKVDFHTNFAGTYELLIYNGTNTTEETSVPVNLISSQTVVVNSTGWISIDIAEPIIIDNTQDLWIFMHNTESIAGLKIYACTSTGSFGLYYSSEDPTVSTTSISDYAFLIKAYLTDGTYTYNLYQDGEKIVENISETNYSGVPLNNNATNLFTVTTNYYGGESGASNKVGFSLGTISRNDLELGDNDNMTVMQNSTLTIGNLTNANPANLVIEDGGQLITSSEGVQATVKKNIQAASNWSRGDNTADGWHFIASPIAGEIEPDANNGLASGDYDLYYYDEPTHFWRNHKQNSESTNNNAGFKLNSGKGYLYANADAVQLSFAGPLSTEGTIHLDFNTDEEAVLAGWNLVGNPFTYNAYIGQAYYIHNGTSVKAKTAADPIAPCTGVLVQATESDQTVTFTQTAPSESKGDLQMTVAQQVINRDGTSTPSTGSGTSSVSVDNAIVSFNKDNQLGKFYFGEKKANLYIPQDGKEYAVASNNGQAEMPLNFKAHESGTYTLNIEANDMDLEYLHLIDNLTGADVNLLETPSYTFEAKTNDYVSRFRLVFSDTGDAGSDNLPFAFVSNGQLQIFNQGEALLQIVDIMGHILSSESIHGDYDKPLDLSAGVYIMRLSNAQTTRTQKIVVQ